MMCNFITIYLYVISCLYSVSDIWYTGPFLLYAAARMFLIHLSCPAYHLTITCCCIAHLVYKQPRNNVYGVEVVVVANSNRQWN
jgi:hypothetical protein